MFRRTAGKISLRLWTELLRLHQTLEKELLDKKTSTGCEVFLVVEFNNLQCVLITLNFNYNLDELVLFPV